MLIATWHHGLAVAILTVNRNVPDTGEGRKSLRLHLHNPIKASVSRNRDISMITKVPTFLLKIHHFLTTVPIPKCAGRTGANTAVVIMGIAVP
ncbi:Os03g0708750 [Oryza sativa Japonica Group]|uniref:Os03g0708750 protein n=1 Tax=Oryza sativa subsp. japonica TaxID=39947 RepID=A0A0P0W2L5_ORYSJ|nr:hypothetical protein EE612_019961 [Oryza sativa]BAS86002.1 Os03g0708750 [Oryza sativa Japonica Group]